MLGSFVTSPAVPTALDSSAKGINWEMWTALATTAYAAIAAVALIVLFVGWRQLKATVAARRLEVLNHAFNELHADQAKADRRQIYASRLRRMSDVELETLQRQRTLRSWGRIVLTGGAVERTADIWQHIALLADRDFVDKEILFDYFHWPLLKCHSEMRYYLRWRQRWGNHRFAQFFVDLAGDFEDRYKNKWGDDEFARSFGARTLRDV